VAIPIRPQLPGPYTIWPQPEDKEFKSFEEHCITFATLLGLRPICGTVTDPGWTAMPWYHQPDYQANHLFSNSLGELSYRFILHCGYQLCHDASDDTWSLVRV
jgi:hypothetical protein